MAILEKIESHILSYKKMSLIDKEKLKIAEETHCKLQKTKRLKAGSEVLFREWTENVPQKLQKHNLRAITVPSNVFSVIQVISS